VAADQPPAVLQAGALRAITAHFDFFPQPLQVRSCFCKEQGLCTRTQCWILLQRRAVSLASVLCTKLRSKQGVVLALDAMPALSNALVHADDQIADMACQCFAGLVSVFSANVPVGKVESSGSDWGRHALTLLAGQHLVQRWILLLEGSLIRGRQRHSLQQH